jgi:hypothetical protein
MLIHIYIYISLMLEILLLLKAVSARDFVVEIP